MSDDHRSSVVVIALLGNPFSPRYARARESGIANALDHCAMNVAVDGPGLSRWSLTERPGSSVARTRDHVAIGASAMRRQADGSIVVDIDERSAPWGTPLRGRITLRPRLELATTVALDGEGAHVWSPRIPLARVEVDLVEPALSFTGNGYFDENAGDAPLESAFTRWSWSRVSTGDEVAIAYDVALAGGRALSHGVTGGTHVDLGRTRFGLPRAARVEAGAPCRIVRTLEDGPFYARSVVETSVGGRRACGVHETVSLERFASRWVRFLLPFRMRVEAA